MLKNILKVRKINTIIKAMCDYYEIEINANTAFLDDFTFKNWLNAVRIIYSMSKDQLNKGYNYWRACSYKMCGKSYSDECTYNAWDRHHAFFHSLKSPPFGSEPWMNDGELLFKLSDGCVFTHDQWAHSIEKEQPETFCYSFSYETWENYPEPNWKEKYNVYKRFYTGEEIAGHFFDNGFSLAVDNKYTFKKYEKEFKKGNIEKHVEYLKKEENKEDRKADQYCKQIKKLAQKERKLLEKSLGNNPKKIAEHHQKKQISMQAEQKATNEKEATQLGKEEKIQKEEYKKLNIKIHQINEIRNLKKIQISENHLEKERKKQMKKEKENAKVEKMIMEIAEEMFPRYEMNEEEEEDENAELNEDYDEDAYYDNFNDESNYEPFNNREGYLSPEED